VNNCETKRGMQNCKENVNKERKKKKREEEEVEARWV
jgi:hypothetical protein